MAIAFFFRADFQSPKMLPQRIAHQGRTVSIGLLGRSICSVQEFLVQNNLNRFHCGVYPTVYSTDQETRRYPNWNYRSELTMARALAAMSSGRGA